MKVTRPAITSASAGPLPLKGTLIIFVPVAFSSIAPARCVEPPLPEVLERIVLELAFQEDRIHQQRERREQQRVAVGRGSRHGLGGDDGVRAGLVLDDEGLAERSGHVLRDDARDHVGGPGRRETDDELYRLCWVALSRGAAGKRAQGGDKQRGGCSSHGSSVFSSLIARRRTSSPSPGSA